MKKVFLYLFFGALLTINLGVISNELSFEEIFNDTLYAKQAEPPGDGGGGGGGGCYTYGDSAAYECVYECWPFWCTGSRIVCNYGPCICYNNWFCN